MNGHISDFRHYSAGRINKMDSKVLYDHLIHLNMDYFQVCIVDVIHVGNDNENQLQELNNRKVRKWIWDLDSVTSHG